MPTTSESDEAIVRDVKAGDAEAFGVLIDRYEQKLTRYARKFLYVGEEAEDLVQDVFVKAYVNIQSFDDDKKFSPWIYRIAHNLFINELKKKQRAPMRFFDPDTLFPHPVAAEETGSEAEQRELEEMLRDFLEHLPAKYREPIVLNFFENMSYAEIAEVLKLPVSTVGVRIKRAKEKLRALYEQKIS